MRAKIFIDGEHGTTGLQIRGRLARRDDLDLLSLPEAERRNRDLREEMLKGADVAILCLPDDASREAIAMLEGVNSTRVIDTSTAFRTHPDWAYGFPEMSREQSARIASARFVANPGCYPTGAIGLVRPLVSAGVVPADYPVTINAVSGYSGGGKNLIAQMEDEGRAGPYRRAALPLRALLSHKHVPEMQVHSGLSRAPIFAPSVGRFVQGMIVQFPLHIADLAGNPTMEDIHGVLSKHYEGEQYVEVVPLAESAKLPRIDPTELVGTNVMKIFVFGTEGKGQVNLVALLDNLGKGASGAAVQNLDLMIGGR